MARLIDADEMTKGICFIIEDSKELLTSSVVRKAMLGLVDRIKTVDAAPVRQGKWDLLVAKRGECEWAADACCSLCGFTKRQIWRGYFPVETTEFARGTTTHYAEKVKLPNYCEQCGADLKGDKNEVD